MPLTDAAIRRAKPVDKPQKLADGGGLFLLVHPNGSRYWRWKYRVNGGKTLLRRGLVPNVQPNEGSSGPAIRLRQVAGEAGATECFHCNHFPNAENLTM